MHCYITVLVSSGCPNKRPFPGGLRQCRCMFTQFWRLEDWDQAAVVLGSGEGSLPGLQRATFLLYLYLSSEALIPSWVPSLRTDYLPISKYHRPSSWISVSNYLHVSEPYNSSTHPPKRHLFLEVISPFTPSPHPTTRSPSCCDTQRQGLLTCLLSSQPVFMVIYVGLDCNHTRA